MIYVGVFFLGVVFGVLLLALVSGNKNKKGEDAFEQINVRAKTRRIETIKAFQIMDMENPYHNSDFFKNEIKRRLLSELIESADKAGAVTYIETQFHESRIVRIEARLMVGVKE